MKNLFLLLVMSVLMIAFATVITSDKAFAETVTVDECPGAGRRTNDCFFVPSEVIINVGDTVVWTNSDYATHTVTSGFIDEFEKFGELFDSGTAEPGSTFEYTFDTPGEYPYLCEIHPWMIGNVIVKSSMYGDPDLVELAGGIIEEPPDLFV